MQSLKHIGLAIVGAAIGGFIGYEIFFWLVHQGFYALAVPGGLAGLGGSLLARHRSPLIGTVLAVIALLLGLYTEWSFEPFIADAGFGYFVTHVTDLKAWTLLMLAIGAIVAFVLGNRTGST